MAQTDPAKETKRLKRMVEGIDLPEDELQKLKIEMQIDLGLDPMSSADELSRLTLEQEKTQQSEIEDLLASLKDKPEEVREAILEEIAQTSAAKSVFDVASQIKVKEEEPDEPEEEEPIPAQEAVPVDAAKVDSKVALRISEDKMQAWLSITPPKHGGRGPNQKILEEYLRRKGVLWGIDKKSIPQIIKEINENGKSITNFEIATGRPVEAGRDAQMKILFEESEPSDFKGQIETEDALAIGRVAKGTPLLKLRPAVIGRMGMTVTGEEIKAEPVKSLQIETKRNTQRVADEIVSEIDGVAYLYESSIIVKAYADAIVEVEIDDDRMTCFANLTPSIGDGFKLGAQMVKDALSAAGVNTGINERIIEDAVTKCEADKIPLTKIPIAKGEMALNGSDGKLVFKIRLQAEPSLSRSDQEKVDYREKESIVNIAKDTLVAIQFPPQPKISDGKTVTGEVIEGIAGNPVEVIIGPNLEVRKHADGKIEYYSEIDGQVVFADGKLDVEPLFVVEKDVDMSVGNIDFLGNVLVKGNVNDDFTVKAGGDIEVRGTVNAAHLIAGRDIYVKNGVIARSAGSLRAGNNVIVRFAENANIIAKNNITIDRAAMLSEVAAGNTIVCKKEKGQIIGGHTIARHLIEVKELGSSSGAKTEVTIGMDYFQMEQINSLNAELQKFTRALEKIDAVLERIEKSRLESGKLTPELELSNNELLQKKLLVQRKIHEVRKQKLNILLEISDNREGELIVQGTLYTDVKINLGKSSLETQEQRDRQHVRADQKTGKLIIEPWLPKSR